MPPLACTWVRPGADADCMVVDPPLLLLLLPAGVTAFSLSRLPPIPLLVAPFTAGFATARHLTPTSQHHSLTALLADPTTMMLSWSVAAVAGKGNNATP